MGVVWEDMSGRQLQELHFRKLQGEKNAEINAKLKILIIYGLKTGKRGGEGGGGGGGDDGLQAVNNRPSGDGGLQAR